MRGARALAALLVLAMAARAGAAEGEIRARVQEAIARGDRLAALAALDTVLAPGAAHERAKSVEAANAAIDLVGGPDGRLAAARILLDTLTSDRSDRGGAYSVAMGLRALVLRKDPDPLAARALLAGLSSIYPEQLEFRYELADLLRDQGLRDEARELYRQIADLAPSEREARIALITLADDAGAADEAIQVCDEMIAVRGGDLWAHLRKTSLLWTRRSDFRGARAALDAGIAAAQASANVAEREDYLARFEDERHRIEWEEEHREALRRVAAGLDRALLWTGLAWALVLGGGLVTLRRARWI